MNPELQRYLWLEMTPHRLVATPIVLAALFGLVHLTSDGAPAALAVTAWWVVVVLGVLWGARSTSEAVASEVSDGTWDQQRLTSLAPWSMTWGKLAGAPVFTWYAALPCLAVLVAGASARMPAAVALEQAALLAVVVLFAQAVGLLASVHGAAGAAVRPQWRARGLHLVGAGAALPMLIASWRAFTGDLGGSVDWFGVDVSARAFTWGSVVAFTAWAVIGCHRLMRRELQLRNGPLAWIGFVAFCMAWAGGLSWRDGEFTAGDLSFHVPLLSVAGIVTAHATALALGYAALFTEVKDPVTLRRLLAGLRTGAMGTVLESVPRWAWSLPFAVATVAGAASAGGGLALCVSSLLFFVRDAGLVVLLNLGTRRARADAAAMLYLLLLYGLAPMLLEAATPWHAAGWLWPLAEGSLALAVVPAALQAALAWAAVSVRWRRVRPAAA